MVASPANFISDENFYDEQQRLTELRAYDVLDTPPEEVFDELARMATVKRISHRDVGVRWSTQLICKNRHHSSNFATRQAHGHHAFTERKLLL